MLTAIPPKIDEIRYTAARNNAAVIGISKSKLDETVFQSEIKYPNMSCSDVIGAETVNLLLAISEVILFTHKNTNIFVNFFCLKLNL